MKCICCKLSKIDLAIIIISALISAGYFLFYLLNKDYAMMLLSFTIVVSPFVLYLIDRKYKMNDWFEFYIIIFIFLSVVLGMIMNLYNYVPGYDKFVHFISGILISALIYEKIHSYNKIKKYSLTISIITLNLFIALLWEFFEFILDLLFDVNAQKGTRDTILDVVFAVSGSILFIFIYRRKNNYFFGKR